MQEAVYAEGVGVGFGEGRRGGEIMALPIKGKSVCKHGYPEYWVCSECNKKGELKPCPFCGGEASIEQELDGFYGGKIPYVKCVDCGARKDHNFYGTAEGMREQAVIAWNTRCNEKTNKYRKALEEIAHASGICTLCKKDDCEECESKGNMERANDICDTLEQALKEETL